MRAQGGKILHLIRKFSETPPENERKRLIYNDLKITRKIAACAAVKSTEPHW
jgi:hypothetical protein